MTILRGAVYADHYGERDDRCPYIDQGMHRFSYQIFPYRSASDAHRRAAVLNMPLRGLNSAFHHGPLGERFEGICNESPDVIVTAIKMAEDGEHAVVRVLETEGREGRFEMRLLDKSISHPVTPYSVKTLDEDGAELNFMEWESL